MAIEFVRKQKDGEFAKLKSLPKYFGWSREKFFLSLGDAKAAKDRNHPVLG